MIFQVLLWSVKNWISLKSRRNFGRKFYWISILHSLGCHSYRFSVNIEIKVLTFLHSLTTSNSPGANKGGKHKHLSPPSPSNSPLWAICASSLSSAGPRSALQSALLAPAPWYRSVMYWRGLFAQEGGYSNNRVTPRQTVYSLATEGWKQCLA